MQPDAIPLTALTEGGASGEPEPIDSRPTRAEAYAAAAIYERLLDKHRLAALYTVEVEHIGYLEWAIYLIPHSVDACPAATGEGNEVSAMPRAEDNIWRPITEGLEGCQLHGQPVCLQRPV
jgi:hypothetical protein